VPSGVGEGQKQARCTGDPAGCVAAAVCGGVQGIVPSCAAAAGSTWTPNLNRAWRAYGIPASSKTPISFHGVAAGGPG